MAEISNKILFSIVIPTYNRSTFLLKTIRSFIDQEYKNFELIIVDDGGSDNSEEVSKSFKDERIKYYWKENAERGAARNFGASISKGLYINFFDSDDIALKNHLKEAFKAIEFLNNPMVFHLGMNMIDENKKEIFSIKKTNDINKIYKYNYVNPNAVFIHRNAFQNIRYNEDRSLSGSEDWLFHLQLASRFQFISFDKFVTSTMINHAGRSMTNSFASDINTRRKLLLKYLNQDVVFVSKKYQWIKVIEAEMLSLTSLHFALENKISKSYTYFLISIYKYPMKIFTKRFLAINKINAFSLFKVIFRIK